MRHTWVVAINSAIVLCLATAVAALPGQGPVRHGSAGALERQDFHFGIKVELVSLFATVHDSKGRLVTGLGPDDFVVFDNETPQPICQFSREYVPLSIVILLDTSASMAGKKLDTAKRSLSQFLKHLRGGDEAGLIAFDSRPAVLQNFTADLDRIQKAMRGMKGVGSTALYDAILAGLRKAEEGRNRRRVLLLLSDGMNTYGNTALGDTISQLRRSAAELFAIGLEPDLQDAMQYQASSRPILDRLTGSAGGAAFVVAQPKELGRVCDEIADRIHAQYTIAYYPPRDGTAGWHSVRIAPRKAGLRVVASKTGYFR